MLISRRVELRMILVLCTLVCLFVPTMGYCPRSCSCLGQAIDCSFRKLQQVPASIPTVTTRLDLQGNNISVIRRSDFRGLTNLKVLQLLDNSLTTIEKGAFNDLLSLERVRLNRNMLVHIPNALFENIKNLQRLDLSDNRLTAIGTKTLAGPKMIKNLQLDNNQIVCIADIALRDLRNMEILTLNRNNLTTLPKNIFVNMKKLRVTRIADNPLSCDCRLEWLSAWLRMHPTLALYTKCGTPSHLRQREVMNLRKLDFGSCNRVTRHLNDNCDRFLEGPQLCPDECVCPAEGIVDCRDKGLKSVPTNIPETITELRLEHNMITEIPSRTFASYRNLRRIDLSNNQISSLAPDAFAELKSLNSLVLYGNKISELPAGIFKGLSSLQLLLLNANKISCVRGNTFQDLHQLNLLSLYDNSIQSLANGTFNPLKNIQTLHLARNPFICDCNLRWLSNYLHAHPIETSGARCEMPRRMQRKKIGHIRSSKFRCKGSEMYRTRNAGQCVIEQECPSNCFCRNTIIDCSGSKLTSLPDNLPSYVTDLRLSGNVITRIPSNGIFTKLPNLQSLDLRNNKISIIEDGAFEGAKKLATLQLTSNQLVQARAGTFKGLKSLRTLILRSNRMTCINNQTFVGMPNLKLLSLYGNQIRCIQPGSFDKLKQITNLNLLSNPFNCNCQLRWLSDWLKKKDLTSSSPRCALPNSLKDYPIREVRTSQMVCPESRQMSCHPGPSPCCPTDIQALQNEEAGCDRRAHCPKHCKCSGTVVRCSRKKLTTVPNDIPLDTTELDLSNNIINTIPEHTFVNMTKLSTLILSYNKIQCIQKKSFAGLGVLRVLSLHGNNMSSLPYGAFDDLKKLTHIGLGANPLYCDCNLKWFSDWIKKDYKEPGIASCYGPMLMRSKLVLTTESRFFECLTKQPSVVLAKCNICYTNPCKNKGVCKLKDFNSYTCRCLPGFHGKHCESEIDACFGSPCANGGTCVVGDNSLGRFSCVCPRGFEGDHCQTNIDDCIGNKCKNNGTCVDMIQAYKCDCLKGFQGTYCEKKIKYCKDVDPCKNAGTCLDLDNDYRCICPAGWEGKDCSTNKDDCMNNLCTYGSQCIDGHNEYSCKCLQGYAGKFCEISPNLIPMRYSATSVCMNHDCKNKGTCFQPAGSSEYECQCLQGFDGKKCEKLTSLSFQRGSYVQLPDLSSKPSANITLTFKTTQPNGILLYQGLKKHVAVEVFRGRIRVSFYIGNYPTSTMYSYATVNDGVFHRLEMLIVKENFTMKLDDDLPRTVRNEGKNHYLEVKEPLYLGGLPKDVARRALIKWHIRDGSSFNGCYRKVYINSRVLDFLTKKLNMNKVIPGCPVQDPCKTNKCRRNGKCVPDKGILGYRCDCKKGYSGMFCDIAPSCHAIDHRVIYVDKKTGCKSRHKIRQRRCQGGPSGGCGNSCCLPKKIKIRKVRVHCTKNSVKTQYVIKVPVVRRCGCKSCLS